MPHGQLLYVKPASGTREKLSLVNLTILLFGEVTDTALTPQLFLGEIGAFGWGGQGPTVAGLVVFRHLRRYCLWM